MRLPRKEQKIEKKQEIASALEQGEIELPYLNKIAKFFKIDICNLFFSEFRENPFLIDFKNKNPSIPLSIDDKHILRYYQNIREDISIFDYNKFHQPKNTIKDDFRRAVKEYKNQFRLNQFLKKKKTEEETFNFLREKIEEEGIYVFKNNKGDKGQKKGLGKDLQGCIFLDNEFPPLILINSDYPKTAQISTLLHEFAHYLLGIAEIEKEQNFGKNKVEKWCNRFAYHFMVPQDAEQKEDFKLENINQLSKKYFVSKASFMIRFRELNLVNQREYTDFFNKSFSCEVKENTVKKQTGGNYHNTKKERLSKKFLALLSNSLMEGRISRSDFAKYVGIKDQQVQGYVLP